MFYTIALQCAMSSSGMGGDFYGEPLKPAADVCDALREGIENGGDDLAEKIHGCMLQIGPRSILPSHPGSVEVGLYQASLAVSILGDHDLVGLA